MPANKTEAPAKRRSQNCSRRLNFQIERSSHDHHPTTKVTRAVVLRARRWFEF
jgi:hypothetical protein